jgi:hypothetical protein
MSDDQTVKINTDREIWRRVPGDYYSPRIFVTERGSIGIDVGGSIYVKPVEDWHALAGGRLQGLKETPAATAPPSREHDVADNGSCAHCGGAHYGSGRTCPYRREVLKADPRPSPPAPTALVCPDCTRPVRKGVEYCRWCRHYMRVDVKPQPLSTPSLEWCEAAAKAEEVAGDPDITIIAPVPSAPSSFCHNVACGIPLPESIDRYCSIECRNIAEDAPAPSEAGTQEEPESEQPDCCYRHQIEWSLARNAKVQPNPHLAAIRTTLEWACKFYCEWYDQGRHGDGGDVAYELVSAIREALSLLGSPSKAQGQE